jgi:putative ABC transport system permease protein
VLIPLRAFQRRIAGNRDVHVIFVAAQNSEGTAKVQRDVIALMHQRRHIADGDPENFRVRDLKEVTDIIGTATGVLTAFLSSIAAVSLVVGGIGIMNIMLVAVTERTREIGIPARHRRARARGAPAISRRSRRAVAARRLSRDSSGDSAVQR